MKNLIFALCTTVIALLLLGVGPATAKLGFVPPVNKQCFRQCFDEQRETGKKFNLERYKTCLNRCYPKGVTNTRMISKDCFLIEIKCAHDCSNKFSSCVDNCGGSDPWPCIDECGNKEDQCFCACPKVH